MLRSDFDPQAPLIDSEGIEYACFADKILGKPLDSWRNVEILSRRARNEPEESIRAWIKAYDGDDYTPGECASQERRTRANVHDAARRGIYGL